MHIGIFRIFYSTTFSLLLLLLLALLLISPADGIYQSYINEQLWNVVVIAGTYLLTLIVSIFIYATRLYTTRTHLASIPKTYIPIRKGDATASVRRLIAEGLERSAAIAYNAHPKDVRQVEDDTLAPGTGTSVPSNSAPVSRSLPAWSTIEHPGWSSPISDDLPNLHYEPVILELPHLLEAKAVSLAPPDPLVAETQADTSSSNPQQILPDPLAVSLLQRPVSMPLHDYLSHLTSLSMIQSDNLTSDFLHIYESARFSAEPLSSASFRNLMANFTTLLETMNAPSPAALAAFIPSTPTTSASSSSNSSTRSLSHHAQIPLALHPASSHPSAIGTAPYTPFLTPHPTPYPASLSSGHAGDRSSDNDSGSDHTAHTAWTRPRRQNRGSISQHTSSLRRPSELQSRRTSGGSGRSGGSSLGTGSEGSVVRRVVTGASAASQMSDGSVVRRAGYGDDILPLPIVFADEGGRSQPGEGGL